MVYTLAAFLAISQFCFHICIFSLTRTQFTWSPKHIKVRLCKRTLERLLVYFYFLVFLKKKQNIPSHFGQSNVMIGEFLLDHVFECYQEQTHDFSFHNGWKNTLIKPSAHGIPVVFCSWMLSLEGLITVYHTRTFPRHGICAGWRASAIHFLVLWIFIYLYRLNQDNSC